MLMLNSVMVLWVLAVSFLVLPVVDGVDPIPNTILLVKGGDYDTNGLLQNGETIWNKIEQEKAPAKNTSEPGPDAAAAAPSPSPSPSPTADAPPPKPEIPSNGPSPEEIEEYIKYLQNKYSKKFPSENKYEYDNYDHKEFQKNYIGKNHPICKCPEPKIMVDGECYTSLKKAMEKNKETFGDPVTYIASDVTVEVPILLMFDASLYGIDCNANSTKVDDIKRPKVLNMVTGTEDKKRRKPKIYQATFMLISKTFNALRLRNVVFDSVNEIEGEKAFAPLVLAPKDREKHRTSLDVRNCLFKNFVHRENGSIFNTQIALYIKFDKDTVFRDNTIEGYCDCYGGGVFSSMYLSDESYVKDYAYFYNNHARFHYEEPYRKGSEHAEGGCYYFYYIDGDVELNGHYKKNSANEGGVLATKTVGKGGRIKFDGKYEENYVVDGGADCRGGVLRVFELNGKVSMKGVYKDNHAKDNRGAVYAGNYMGNGSEVKLDGEFYDNECKENGCVVSVEGMKSPPGEWIDGDVILEGGCKFKGNKSRKDSTDILWLNNKAKLSSWSGKTKKYD